MELFEQIRRDHQREQQAIASLPDELRSLPIDQVELKPTNIVGVDALATLFTPNADIGDRPEEPALDVADAPLATLLYVMSPLVQLVIQYPAIGEIASATT